MPKKLLLFAFIILSFFGITGCSSDDENVEISSFGDLIVNGIKWQSTISAPNYERTQFFYMGESNGNTHAIVFYEDLMDVEVGEDVTPEDILLGLENAEYTFVKGEVIVTKVEGTDVTLKFKDYTVKFDGLYVTELGDNRCPDIKNKDTLVINGTVTFIRHSNN